MVRNTKEIKLFDETLILSERTAGDVLSFSEFVQNSTEDEKTVGLALYQAALILEAALKINRKEHPRLNKISFLDKILRFLGLNKSYKQFLKETEDVIDFNLKLDAKYILENLTQKEIFELVKEIYLLEGLDIISKENESQKKSPMELGAQ